MDLGDVKKATQVQ